MWTVLINCHYLTLFFHEHVFDWACQNITFKIILSKDDLVQLYMNVLLGRKDLWATRDTISFHYAWSSLQGKEAGLDPTAL